MELKQTDLLVFYDGDCLLCSRTVTFLLKRDKKKVLKYASQQGDAFKYFSTTKLSAPKDSIVLLKNGLILTRSTAVLEIVKELPYPWKFLYGLIIIPRFFRDVIYGLIARNRKKWFGKTDSCYLWSEEHADRFVDFKSSTQTSSP